MLESTRTRTALAAVLLGLALLSVTGALDSRGHAEVEAGLERSLVAFGLARGINAIISVVQGSEVALQPAGLGITLSVGEALDPVNDLVERFSWLMLATSVSFALQRLLLDIGGWAAFSVGAGAVLALTAAALVVRRPLSERLRPPLLRLALAVLVLRFAVPCMAVANELVYTHVLAPRFEQASATVSQVHRELETLERAGGGAVTGPSFEASDGWTDKLSRFFDSVAATVDVRAGWQREKAAYTRAVSAMTNSVIEMMAVFLVQGVLMPLLFVVLVWAALKRAVGVRFAREKP